MLVNLGAEHKFTSYGALYLMASGAYSANPILSAWMANNSEPHYRHATSVALGVLAVNSVCFGYKYYYKFSYRALSIRVASLVPGVSHPRTVQNSAIRQLSISRCT